MEREPIYRQGETLRTFAAGLYGRAPAAGARVGDDALGRALDRLFDADRASHGSWAPRSPTATPIVMTDGDGDLEQVAAALAGGWPAARAEPPGAESSRTD